MQTDRPFGCPSPLPQHVAVCVHGVIHWLAYWSRASTLVDNPQPLLLSYCVHVEILPKFLFSFKRLVVEHLCLKGWSCFASYFGFSS